MQVDRTTVKEKVSAEEAGEELINAGIHALGWILSLYAVSLLIRASWGATTFNRLALSIYSATLISVYSFSTLSHAIQDPRLKHRLRIWDQAVVYFLIAGTYTPFLWPLLDQPLKLGCLVLIWLAAFTGFYLKVFHEHRINNFKTQSYILLGWGPSLLICSTISTNCLAWVAAGGICYTAGTLFLIFDKRVRYFHAVWHASVILGSASHFYAIYGFLIRPQAGT